MTTQVDDFQQNAKELKRFCKVHPYAECDFLFTDPANNTESPFKCDMCLFEQSINTKHLIPIKQIQRSDENTVLWNWPLPDNSALLQRVKEITTGPRSDVKFRDQILVYFKELKAKVNEKINEIEEATSKQAEKLWNFNAHIASEYNRMSAKEVLKQDVLDLQTDPQKLSIKLRETIAAVLASQEQTQRALEKELEEHALQLSAVDLEGPKKIMENVLVQLGQISIFLVDDVSDLERQHNPSNDLGNGNASALYQLATSKMNAVSQEFEERLKQHLLRLKRVCDKADFGRVYKEGKQRLELELLGEQELAQLQHFAESLIHSKKSPPQPNEKLWSSELILELLSNPANQCSPAILKQLQEMFQSISCYFGQSMIAGQFPQPLDLTKLSSEQLKNINKLTKKMTELSLVPGYDYSTAISPIPQLQVYSVHSLSWIKNGSLLKKEQEAEVARVLAQLPVLELLPFNFEIGQKLNWTFEKTNLNNNSSKLEITQVQTGSQIYQKQSCGAQAVSANVLQNELMYELTCSFNKSFGGGCGVIIGLIEEADIHRTYVGGNNSMQTVFYYNGTGASTIIRGSQLSASPLKQKLTSIRFRFCIQSQELFIFDESKTNIVKADPTQIKSTGKYRFGVFFNGPGDDYSVTVCNVKEFKDREEIDRF